MPNGPILFKNNSHLKMRKIKGLQGLACSYIGLMLHPALESTVPRGYLSLRRRRRGGAGGGEGPTRKDTTRHRGNLEKCDPGVFS